MCSINLLKAKILCIRARYYQINGQLKLAEKLLLKSLEITKKEKDEIRGQAALCQNLAYNLMLQGRYKDSMSFFQSAINLIEESSPESVDMANILNNFGQLCRRVCDFEKALECYSRALKIAKMTTGEDALIARILCNRGVIKAIKNNLKDAEQDYKRSVDIHLRVDPNSADAAAALGNLGGIYYQLKDFSTALNYFRKALTIDLAISPTSVQTAIRYFWIGNTLATQGYLVQAKESMTLAKEILDKAAPQSEEMAAVLSALAQLQ
ncbi:tetratricopeptide repeat protein [Patescibacteria group bacterium]|nr:tetratricopeptide repeat protein [Patescibacteria group bacterium]